jgi:hypothetical protein
MGRRSRNRVRAGLQTDNRTREGARQSDAGSFSGSLQLSLLWSSLCDEIASLWERGWQPADVERIVKRQLSANHARLVVDVIAGEAESYRSRQRTLPSWVDQLEQIGAKVHWKSEGELLAILGGTCEFDREGPLPIGCRLLRMLHLLPKIPLLDPPPSQWDRSTAVDAALAWRKRARGGEMRQLERVRALLAKAESTQFEEEADAFTAKAQELMARYSIDAALLAIHAEGKLTELPPRGVRIGIDDPYSNPKALLLTKIALASRCRTVWSKDLGFSTVFGYGAELESVDLLYTSLLVQAGKAMMCAGEMGEHARTPGFRRSFLTGFAHRIGDRLQQSVNDVISDVVETTGCALVPVLAERSKEVDKYKDNLFPQLRDFKSSVSNWQGWVCGTEAANLAEIARGPHLNKATSGIGTHR